MKNLLFIFALIALVGCETSHSYKVTEAWPPASREQIITLPSEELKALCRGFGHEGRCVGVNGMAFFNPARLGKECTIFVREGLPDWEYPCVLNHERKHCWTGAFHGNKPSSSCQ